MTEPTRLILWRHGQTDWNAARRFQGQADVELNAAGHRQAELAAQRLRAERPSVLFSSPLLRAQQTAMKLAAVCDLAIQSAPELREINVGSWSGLTYDEVAAIDPEFVAARAAGRDYQYSEQGETTAETGRRVGNELRRIAQEHSGEVIVAVSHGLAIRMAIAELLGWDFAVASTLAGLGNASWSDLELLDGRWKLRAYNLSAE